MADAASYLRQRPRQARALRRVEHLLDTSERVFEEVGYDAATTNMIAERAEIPVGTLYRWFPDKAALAEGLAARYIDRLADTYQRLVVENPPPTEVIRRATHEIAALVADSPAMPALVAAASLPANEDTAGQRLADAAADAVATVIRLRAPTATDADIRRVASTCAIVLFAVLAQAMRTDIRQREAVIDELADLLIAWLAARFPAPDDPVWDEPDPLVRPIAPTIDAIPGAKRGMGGRSA